MGGKVRWRSHSIELRTFKDPSGNTIWLPVAGKRDNFDLPPSKHNPSPGAELGDKPSFHETFLVLPETVKVNHGLDGEKLIVQFDPRRKVQEPRTNRSGTAANASRKRRGLGLTKADIDAVYAAAEDEKRDLTSLKPVEERNTDWFSVAALACGVLGLAGLVGAWWVRRRA